MTKSVSKVLTTSTVVAAAATVINQVEALDNRPKQNRLRVLQEEGEDASSASPSLSMPTNVESITNLIEEGKPKFQEKKELDLGILMSSVMKNGEFADTVSQAFDEMGEWDKQDLVENVDELVGLVKHLLHGKSLANQSLEGVKAGSSKSGKGSKASLDDGTCSFDGTTIGPFNDVSRYAGFGTCCEDSDCKDNALGVTCFGEYGDNGFTSGRQCYCETSYSDRFTDIDGGCCFNEFDCRRGFTCENTGPGQYDYFCVPSSCEFANNSAGEAGDGDCCYYDDDCASNNCVKGPGLGYYDYFCAPTTDDE